MRDDLLSRLMRVGRILMARGRDAADVAISHRSARAHSRPSRWSLKRLP